MMIELHIHEVLRMMIDKQKSYKDKSDFVQDISKKFGSDVRFYACSGDNMNAEEAFDFLMMRNKISIDNSENISLDPNMTMCDEDGHHHDHNH